MGNPRNQTRRRGLRKTRENRFSQKQWKRNASKYLKETRQTAKTERASLSGTISTQNEQRPKEVTDVTRFIMFLEREVLFCQRAIDVQWNVVRFWRQLTLNETHEAKYNRGREKDGKVRTRIATRCNYRLAIFTFYSLEVGPKYGKHKKTWKNRK